MSLEVSRESFSVVILDIMTARRELVTQQLSQAGYKCEAFHSYKNFEAQLEFNPPHFVVLSFIDPEVETTAVIKQIRENLPETHIILLAPAKDMVKAIKQYENGIFDCLSVPLDSPVQLVRALDRGARLNIYYYQNEQLNDRLMVLESAQSAEKTRRWVPSAPPSEESPAEIPAQRLTKDRLPDFRSWLELLYSQPRQDLSIQAFFAGLAQIENEFKAVYFKYISQRRTLMAAYWHNYEDKFVKTVGLSFNDLDPNFRSDSLRAPQSVSLLQELAETVFAAHDYRWECHTVLGEVQGVFLFVPMEGSLDWDLIDSYMAALKRHTELLELEKRLHSNSLLDPGTEVLNRHTLLRQISEEVSRARRVQHPISLIIVSLDQYADLQESLGTEETEVVLRAIARIFIKHSRVNDVIGRVGSDQFALILPHTPANGAMIKADRLRKIVEMADFSKIVKNVGKLTISLAVCEYPSLSRDADELFQSADEALFQMRSQTSNKITLVKVPPDFMPDFNVEAKS